MRLTFSPRLRAERLIAVGRVVLAVSSLGAVWADPSEPAKFAPTAYALLVAYVVYALVLALAIWRSTSARPLLGLVTHVFDLAFFSAFIYFTAGPASPFIAYFVFSLVCATLRWQWRGTLWTAAVALAVFFGLVYYFAEVLDDPAFELNRSIIRGVYMAVMALLLGYLGWHEERSRDEISQLARWPDRPHGSTAELVTQLLEHAARSLGVAGGAALAWEPAGGGAATFAAWPEGGAVAPLLPGGAESLVAPELVGASLLASAGAERREVLVRRGDTLTRWRGAPFAGAAAARVGTAAAIAVPFRGELSSGRLFLIGPREATVDDLMLAEVVAALAGAQLEGQLLLERMRDGAAVEERVRLARDLHDGVLQSLTGIALRVAASRRLLAEAPEEAERQLEELQRMLTVEQRDLRFFIQDLEPPPEGQPEFDLAQRLAELVRRVEQEWQLAVHLDAGPLDEELPESAERDLYFIVREALVNAVRHGEARRVDVRLSRESADRLRLEIEDDGHGFPRQGRFDQDELSASGSGPRSLRERVVARGGTLVLDSGPGGARLEIEVPL